jgi:RNase P subunit RPR2
MKCYICESSLIEGGDHDITDDPEHSIVTNLTCPDCGALVLVYWEIDK